jgi:L-lysine exporter family protein LysE/ArgO
MSEAFLRGFLLSLAIILPLGPQNILIFNQAAAHPRLRGSLPVVITAALCDTLLMVAAVLGLTLLVLTFAWLQTVIIACGCVFLCYVGWTIFRMGTNQQMDGNRDLSLSPRKQIVLAASVSLFNPHAILDTVGIIGTSALAYTGLEQWTFTTASISVSWLYFVALAIFGRFVGKKDLSGRFRTLLNRISGLTIWAIACYLALELL